MNSELLVYGCTIIYVGNTLFLDFTLFLILCIARMAIVSILLHTILAEVVISLGWNPKCNYWIKGYSH